MAAALLLAACQSDANLANQANSPNQKNSTPSCLPPGYRPCAPGAARDLRRSELPGEELDVKLAVVEDKVITRRQMVREVLRTPEMSDPEYEQQLQQALVRRVRTLIFAHEALRIGLSVRPQILDEVVEDELRKAAREASEKAGRPVSVAEWLAERNVTHDEFRARMREQLLARIYIEHLVSGLGPGARPQEDMTVPPSEVRAVYWSHPGAFDVPRGVKYAVWQYSIERYLSDDVGFLDAEAKARAEAERAAEGFRRGVAPETIARETGLREGLWTVASDFVPRDENMARIVGTKALEWLYDPARKQGDAAVFETGAGLIALGVVETRLAEKVPYEKAYEGIVDLIKQARLLRLEQQRLVEILTDRNVVQPPELHDVLLMASERMLAALDQDPIGTVLSQR